MSLRERIRKLAGKVPDEAVEAVPKAKSGNGRHTLDYVFIAIVGVIAVAVIALLLKPQPETKYSFNCPNVTIPEIDIPQCPKTDCPQLLCSEVKCGDMSNVCQPTTATYVNYTMWNASG